jgi:polysaccharide export outer membrane protein
MTLIFATPMRLRAVFAALALLLVSVLPQQAAAYTIAPGDRLQIEVLEDPSLDRTLLVLPDGSVNFPGAGTVSVAGRSPETVRKLLSDRLANEFANPPTIYVSVAQLAAPGEELAEPAIIYVMGEINGPGAIKAEEGITLLQAIAQAGGFTRFAATKRIELHRMDGASQTEQVYIYNHHRGGGISGATRLADGDVIVVPERRLFE